MSIVNTVWWQAIGLFLFIAVIAACLYCLWDLKREQRAADAKAVNSSEPKWGTATTIYMKPSLYIYPKNKDASFDSTAPYKHSL
ncbi:hypothetical protein [Paenibacillus sp. Y412MC10]|uniref:hypothetical protein n=1 Tax=Geobacillus sp. (strain Y412MC10) TaxID=481743 RepID=UPI00119FC45E|nr:hypothetical protein [Paenibacillus sp. Y412MC10]